MLLCCFDAIGFPGEDRSTDDLGSSFEAQLGRLYSFGVASAAPPFLSTGKGNDGGLQTRTFERGPILESHRALARFFSFVTCQVTVDRLGIRQYYHTFTGVQFRCVSYLSVL